MKPLVSFDPRFGRILRQCPKAGVVTTPPHIELGSGIALLRGLAIPHRRWASFRVAFEGKQMEYHPVHPGEHYRLIVAATWEKVRQNPEVKKALLATGDLVLRPDPHQELNAPEAWRYYEILMQIRSELLRENK